jgi:HSP20 family protein
MATTQALEAQQKRELISKEEKTTPSRYFVPTTDIFEADDALTVVMELPGVDKQSLQVDIENDVLRVEGRIDFSKYGDLEPLYTEYNVGHFARTFALSNKIDQQGISAHLNDGVLMLTLRKVKEAAPRRIAIE